MLLDTGKTQYRIVREVLNGEANDVYVCQSPDSAVTPYKTVWLVRDHQIAKDLMGKLSGVCEECFMHNEEAGFVFPYEGERPLEKFYRNALQGGAVSGAEIWLELIVKCMTSGLPHAVLNVILKQRQIHIGADGTLWFGYFLDLSGYDGQAEEEENVALCAACIMNLIESGTVGKTADAVKNSRVSNLLQKKQDRGKYQEFMQLYSDVRLVTREREGARGKEKFKLLALSGQDTIYRVLAALCIVLVCMTVLVLIGHLFFGEFSFWKLFRDPLDRIGTESLLQ